MSDPIGEALGGAIEHASADALAGLAAQHRQPHDKVCLNCSTELVGDFCHVCGQSGESLRRPFWSLAAESLETLFSIDGRAWRTLPDLVLHPGRMTRAYLDGKRTRFISPFRLYVLASLVFFVVMPLILGQGLAFMPKGTQNFEDARAGIETSYKDGDMTEEEYKAAIEGLDQVEEAWKKGLPGLLTPEGTTAPDVPEGAPAAPEAEAPPEQEWAGIMPKEALDAIREAGANGDPDAARFAEVMDEPGRLGQQTMRWIPRLMFVMLPLYAGLLAFTYLWRPQFLFFDHLIVSLHFHSALFFAMALGALVSPLIGMGWVVVGMIVYSNWYLYRLNRVVYGRGGVSSVLRVLVLDSIYFGFLMTALLTAVILGALSV
jgi:hypothetical protein